MKIRHEKPDPNLSFMVTAPLHLELADGKRVVVEKWSLAGFNLDGTGEQLPDEVTLCVPFQGFDIRFPVGLTADGDKNCYLFSGLNGRHREMLAIFYRAILSGRMVSAKDMIISLDAPIDLVPMEETEEERVTATARTVPRPIRAVLTVTAYILVASFVFGYAGSLIWDRMNTLTLENSRAIAPFINHVSAENAYVERIHVQAGDRVRQGDILVRMNDPERDGEIEQVRAEIRLAEKRLRSTRARLKDHRATTLKRQAALTRRKEARSLFPLPRPRPLRNAQAPVQVADLSGSIPWTVPEETDRADRNMLDLLEERLRERKFDLSRLKRELSNKKDAATANHVVATVDGTVQEILIFKDQFLRRGQNALVIEENTPRQLTGWIDDDQADRVFVGMKGKIAINRNAGLSVFPGTVTGISSAATAAKPGASGIMITVSADDISTAKTRDIFPANAPVSLALDRGLWTSLESEAGDDR